MRRARPAPVPRWRACAGPWRDDVSTRRSVRQDRPTTGSVSDRAPARAWRRGRAASRSAASRQFLVELERWPRDHALSPEEGEDQMVLAFDQSTHARDALGLEARDQRLEQRAAGAFQAKLGIDLD